MKEKRKVRGELRIYLQWPLLLSVLVVAMNLIVGILNAVAGLVMFAFTLVYVGIALWLYFYRKRRLLGGLVEFSSDYSWVQKHLLSEMNLPYALVDEKGRILWRNQKFQEITGDFKGPKKNLTVLFPDITREVLASEQKGTVHITCEDRKFRVDLCPVGLKLEEDEEQELELSEAQEKMVAVYLFDETRILQYEQEINDQKMVCGLIYLDNYEEALESVEEVRRSLLTALIDRKISKYIGSLCGVVKKTEKDKYFFAIKQKYVDNLRESRFSILEEVKTVNIGNEMAVTLSIGLGMNGESYMQNYEFSRTAIDMALGRGGDQAVIKDGSHIQYYGGKSQQTEKATRVKARVKAHALRELMETKDRLLIMGHKMGDIDSLGAAIGIYRAAKVLGKRAYIVINEVTSSVRPMKACFEDNPAYETDMFLTSEQAVELIDQNTVLVVVDTNRPSYTECPELLKRTSTIVVLDHHRQTNEQITNAILSYIEPYASSACEMVAEILQYFDEGLKIKAVEADCLYGGIIIDTNNFTSKTGVRTFEAAAFLRRCGADVTRVRKMFRSDMSEYKAKAEAVRHAQLYHGFAISVCPNEHIESPTIVGAQAANELLNINGVRASIVLTDYQHKTYVSARSIDEVNVQVMMERLGGGGHMNMAGAQLDCGVEEAIEIVKHTIDKLHEEGEF